MAFGNYIGPDTYTVVDRVHYEKVGRSLRFELMIYTDSSKLAMLATKTFFFNGNHHVYPVQGGVRVDPPENPILHQKFVTGVGCTGAWTGYDNHVAEFMNVPNQTWRFWQIGMGNCVYNVEDSKTYKFSELNTWVHVVSEFGDALWSKFFDPTIVQDSTTNLWKQLYLFLKTCPGFENVTDI